MAFPIKNAWNLIFLSSQEPTEAVTDIFLLGTWLYIVEVLVYVLLFFPNLVSFLFLLQKGRVIHRYTSSPPPHFLTEWRGQVCPSLQDNLQTFHLGRREKVCWWCGTWYSLDWEDNTEFPNSVCKVKQFWRYCEYEH